jgi:hypothetical protein
MRQKMNQLEGQPQATPTASPESVEKAREAMRQQIGSTAPVTPAPTATKPTVAAAPKPAEPAPVAVPAKPPEAPRPVAKGKALALAPLAGPASPLSANKQDQLAELLRRYKADEITPEQYHAERAKVLAGQ